MNKEYLGDSVYCDIENGMIKLSTENNLPNDPSNVIFMEEEVLNNLFNYIERLRSQSHDK